MSLIDNLSSHTKDLFDQKVNFTSEEEGTLHMIATVNLPPYKNVEDGYGIWMADFEANLKHSLENRIIHPAGLDNIVNKDHGLQVQILIYVKPGRASILNSDLDDIKLAHPAIAINHGQLTGRCVTPDFDANPTTLKINNTKPEFLLDLAEVYFSRDFWKRFPVWKSELTMSSQEKEEAETGLRNYLALETQTGAMNFQNEHWLDALKSYRTLSILARDYFITEEDLEVFEIQQKNKIIPIATGELDIAQFTSEFYQVNDRFLSLTFNHRPKAEVEVKEEKPAEPTPPPVTPTPTKEEEMPKRRKKVE